MSKHEVLVPYTGRINPYISIVAYPNSYTMDVMEISSYVVDDKDNPLYAQNNSLNANIHAGGNKYVLVLIETTSRRLFTYPLKTKTAAEVASAFKKFLKDCNERIDSLTMDSGKEYSDVKKLIKDEKLAITTYVVVAAEGRHTTLSRVDRVIRTLRVMIFNYFKEYKKFNWNEVIKTITDVYNTTKHSSLFYYDKKKKRRIFLTPNQVWSSPSFMKLVNAKDRMRRPNGNKYIKQNMKEGNTYNYLVNTGKMSKGSSTKRGMISNDTVTIKKRIGNSFVVSSENKKLDGKVIPYRNLIPAKKVENLRKKQLLSRMFDNLDQDIKLDKIAKERPKTEIIKPSAKRELERLARDYLHDKRDKKGMRSNILPGRTRSQTTKELFKKKKTRKRRRHKY